MPSTVFHTTDFVWLLDPGQPFAGPVRDGGTIVAKTAPGCWGPMITPDYPSGHEVTRPVAIEGATIGDAVALKIRKIQVLSLATTSGTDRPQEGNYVGSSASVAARCPKCGTVNPETYLDGVGEDAIRCKRCGTPVKPFRAGSTYTILMDDERKVAVTVPPEVARGIAQRASEFSALPQGSRQYSANLIARGEIPGLVVPLRPMIGNIGSCPSVAMPSSHNAGDSGRSLIGAPHAYSLTKEQFETGRTDAHMDVNEVVEGAVVIVPVKVDGAGIYVGDVHAMMGDGELAGHTTDVSAEVVIDVKVIKGLALEGPILLPVPGDLSAIVRPRGPELRAKAAALARQHGFELEEESLPIQVIGTGETLNAATANGLQRISNLTRIPLDEVMNRCTLMGQVEVGRLSGVVQVSMLVPCSILRRLGLYDIVAEQYA